MKGGFYIRLAEMGVLKNKKTYLPYILTCVGMVMMYYIMEFLTNSPLLELMTGGDVLKSMLNLGRFVMTVFSVIFLFYTNSFIIRRRKKEFGLYNMLGMDKKNIARILSWETLITGLISIGGGLAAGMLFSKLAEVVLVNIMHYEVNYSLSVSPIAVFRTIIVFGLIFCLIFLNVLRQIWKSNPAELLRSETAGEKPPKANWIMGALGAVLLVGAYILAISIKDVVAALGWFFIAVIMVIIGTYLLFIFGSVVFCRILKGNKNYYYKPNHFVSVSSMLYRMKRHGAGLASVCILSTMVLVMMTTSVCMYADVENALQDKYPRDIAAEVNFESFQDMTDNKNSGNLKSNVDSIAEKEGSRKYNELEYYSAFTEGIEKSGRLSVGAEASEIYDSGDYDNLYIVYFITLDDYNRIMNADEELESDQILFYISEKGFAEDSFAMGDKVFYIKKQLEELNIGGSTAMFSLPSMYMVIQDWEALDDSLKVKIEDSQGGRRLALSFNWKYYFDTNSQDQVDLNDDINARLKKLSEEKQDGIRSFSSKCMEDDRAGFYAIYGSVLFLGIMLSIVFMFATVLIIYYKQVSEGYEDQSRFEIMQKVGMTEKEIRKSINSQVLTVFFLPLITAGMHLTFAFPMIHRILMLFNLFNLKLQILTTISGFLIFALFYMIIYKITSNAYYSIVSGKKKKRRE